MHKRLIYLHNLFEIQFLKIDVQSSDKEVDKVALLQFAGPHTSEVFQNIRYFSIEFIEAVNTL